MATTKKELIEIRPLEEKRVNITLVGDTPLIVHQWSEKAKKEILDNEQGKKKGKKKDPRNPAYDFITSMYWLDDAMPKIKVTTDEDECKKLFIDAVKNGARFGFPATAFKKAACSAAYRLGWAKDKVSLYGAFYIEADKDGLVEIKSPEPPEPREDAVKVKLSSDLRYRGEFKEWSTSFVLVYYENTEYSLENIINMLNAGGKVCGAGEWRIEKGGQNGKFHVETN